MYENLKAEMARQNLTMSDVGARCNFTLQKFSSRMKGKTPFTVDEALDIRKKLHLEHIPVEVLFEKEVKTK